VTLGIRNNMGLEALGVRHAGSTGSTIMRKMMLIAAALLLASSVGGYARQKGSNAGGASEYSPGDQMKDRGGPTPGFRGASEFAPGDQKKDSGSTVGRGASEFSPGDRAKDSNAGRSGEDVQKKR
jgi:hypothetical protein